MSKGVLYVVATPIGNLEDFSPRARDTLATVSVIAAEDTRHSNRLLRHFGIERPLVAVHDHNESQVVERLVGRLLEGESVALVSDAGTPLISDPGYRLVLAAHQAGVVVSPVPGACAAIAALSAAGLPNDRFSFEGFLPAKAAARKAVLASLKGESRTLVFYEAPHRVLESLQDMREVLGDRPATLAREVTKAFETIRRSTLGELVGFVAADDNQQRGEIVLVVGGAPATESEAGDVEALEVLDVLLSELPVSQAADLAARITGRRKKWLYEAALERKGR